MDLTHLKQIINDNWSSLRNRELHLNSNKTPYGEESNFLNTINSLEYNPAMTYRLELCTNDYPTAVSNKNNTKELDKYIKSCRFSQVKIFVEPIVENTIVSQPTEKAIQEFGINH